MPALTATAITFLGSLASSAAIALNTANSLSGARRLSTRRHGGLLRIVAMSCTLIERMSFLTIAICLRNFISK
jgi:hypothetical protein